MNKTSAQDEPTMGLRERKKAKTRAEIQKQALRLFRRHGYAATTVEQIAEAAEVSPSTFFRYFPTKEDVVLWDDYDPLLIEAFKSQPFNLGTIQAVRVAIKEVFSSLTDEQMDEQHQRSKLIFSIPELRAAMLNNFTDTVQMMALAVAEREKRSDKDFAVRNLAGALIGVLLSSMLAAAEDPKADILELMDAGLAHLEAGLPL